MRHILFLIVSVFFTIQLRSQHNPDAKVDTSSSYDDNEAFMKELSEMLDTMDLTEEEISDSQIANGILGQTDELMQLIKLKFSDIYNADNYIIKGQDTIYSSSYRFEGAEKNEVIRDAKGYVGFVATFITDRDLEVCGLAYDALLQKCINEFGERYKAESEEDTYETEFFPSYTKDPGRLIYLAILPRENGEYELIFTIRGDIEFIDTKNKFDLWDDKPVVTGWD